MLAVERSQFNGLNVETLDQLMNMLKEHPQEGLVTFYATTTWQEGARAFTRFGSYAIDGQMQHQQTRQFVVLSDEPRELSGTDTTPGPVEALMYALGACIAATTTATATRAGVWLDHLEVALESDVDLHGMFGLNDQVPSGILHMQIEIRIGGDADPGTLRRIALQGYQRSPVRESVEHGVPLETAIHVAG